jgi:hypothetical protein
MGSIQIGKSLVWVSTPTGALKLFKLTTVAGKPLIHIGAPIRVVCPARPD